MKKRILHLPVKKIYFDQIKSGKKLDEYRLVTEYWKKGLKVVTMMKSMLSVVIQRLGTCLG